MYIFIYTPSADTPIHIYIYVYIYIYDWDRVTHTHIQGCAYSFFVSVCVGSHVYTDMRIASAILRHSFARSNHYMVAERLTIPGNREEAPPPFSPASGARAQP